MTDIAYIDDKFNPVSPDEATLVKVRMDDGRIVFARPVRDYATWDEEKHPRHPAGDESGGEFAPKGSDLDDESTRLGGKVVWRAMELRKHMSPEKAAALARHGVAWGEKLGNKERAMFQEYSDFRYREINHCLRRNEGCNEGILADAKTMAKEIDKSTLPVDLEVYRTLNYKTEAELEQFRNGKTFTDKGFVSSTVDKEQVTHLGPGVPAKFVITVPKGSKGVYLEGITEHLGEHEVLLPANSKFEITKADYTDPQHRVVVHAKLL